MSFTCVRNHAEPGAHRVTCTDHPGWDFNPGACHGCLPVSCERGFLCYACYDRTVNAVAAWSDFVRAVEAADGRLVTPEGKGAIPGGYSNLSATYLTLDECRRLLVSRGDRTVDVWVHDEDGARDAIRFAAAAEHAYQTLEVVEREQQVIRERCPGCGFIAPVGNITRQEHGATVVSCCFCGHQLARIRPDINRWVGSATCEHRMHAECVSTDCRCDCHTLGAQSRPGGVQALWDADQHTVTTRRRLGRERHQWREPRAGEWVTHHTRGRLTVDPNPYRGDWVLTDTLTIQHINERETA